MKNTPVILIFIALALLSCSKDNGGAEYDVDPIFEPYVQMFVEEAAKRGMDFDFRETGLKVELSDRQLEFAGGFCYWGENHIVINKSVWLDGYEEYKTRLMFHELGHCALARRHKNDRFDNLLWQSIMRGDPLNAAERRIPVPFFGFRKAYYIEELFFPFTEEPDWANPDIKYNDYTDADKTTLYEVDDINRLNLTVQTNPENYEIDIQFSLSTVPAQSTQVNWSGEELTYNLTIWPQNLFTINAFRGSTQIFLYRENNTLEQNGRHLDHITIRRVNGIEQIFINERFIFHVDALPGPLRRIRFESLVNLTDELNLELDIHKITLSALP